MDYDTWKATEPEALVDVTPCEICGAVGEQPCCQDWIDCPRCGHEIERADNSPCDVHEARALPSARREDRWWDTYNAAVVGLLCAQGHAWEGEAVHGQATALANQAHGRITGLGDPDA